MRRLLLLLASLALSVAVAHGSDLGRELAKAFVGGCVQILPQTQRIEAAARSLHWKPVEGDAAALLAPKEASAKWQGWLVDQGPAPPYFMFVSEGPFQGAMQKICGVSNPYAPYDDVFNELTSLLELGEPATSDVSLGQRTTVWKIQNTELPIWLSIVDATPMKEPGLTISAFAKSDSN